MFAGIHKFHFPNEATNEEPRNTF